MKIFLLFLPLIFQLNLSFGQSCSSGNCENGFGIYSFSNGDVYRGNWINGKRSGYGEHYFNNGDAYKGDFENSLFSGKGTYFFANGDIDVSIYAEGVKTSQISYTWGSQKKGGCVSGDCQNGYGRMIYSDVEYEGNFVNGIRNGQGKMTYPNGNVHSGNWVNGIRNGQGKFVWASGSSFEGNWVDGKMEGYGIRFYLDESKYIGNFKDGKRHGSGRHEYTNGKIEEGTFENGKFLGTPTQATISANTSQNTQESNIKFIQDKLVEFSALLALAEKNLQNINDDSFDNQTNQANEILTMLKDFNKKNQIPKEKGELLVTEKYKLFIDLMKRRSEYLALVIIELEKIKKQQEANKTLTNSNSTGQKESQPTKIALGQPNAFQCSRCLYLSMGTSKPGAYTFGGCSDDKSHSWIGVSTTCEHLQFRNTIMYKTSTCLLQCGHCGAKSYMMSVTAPFGGRCPNDKYGVHDWNEY